MKTLNLNQRRKVVIIGAGICGLGIGWRLASAGCQVTILDKGVAGQGASWAAAGMLAGGVETEPGEQALHVLNKASQNIWPEFARELSSVTGLDLGYRSEGTLVVASTRDDLAKLRFNHDFQVNLGIELDWLTGEQARKREPRLRRSLAGAVFSRNDHQVENRQLTSALHMAAVGAGCTLIEHMPATSVQIKGDRVAGVWSDKTYYPADEVVLAAGAWSNAIEGIPDTVRPPVRPVKGQLLSVRMEREAPLLSHVVWSSGIYLVPRLDGRLIVGATVEERGFNTDLTAGGLLALLEAAWRIVPGIEELPIDETWVGFRPTSRDDAPILGPTSVDGLVMATGHHRNGVLLAPITANAVSEFVLNGHVRPELEPFLLERFSEANACVSC